MVQTYEERLHEDGFIPLLCDIFINRRNIARDKPERIVQKFASQEAKDEL